MLPATANVQASIQLAVMQHVSAGVSHPYHSGDSTFILVLHVNEEAFDGIDKDFLEVIENTAKLLG